MVVTYVENIYSHCNLKDAVVFVVGGGNYMEYTNLSLYAKNKATSSPKRLVYGCTDVVNAEQFLTQVCKFD